MSERTALRRRVIIALLIVPLTACQTWRPTFVRPQQLIPAERPTSVRATLWSGGTVTLENPTMRNDSVFGAAEAGLVGVASEDVGMLEVQQLDVLRSIGLGSLVFSVFLFTALVFTDAPVCC